MQRMFNLREWTEIADGGSLSFHSARPRIVRFEVNTPDEVLMHICYPDGIYVTHPPENIGEAGSTEEVLEPGTVQFLAKVTGRETIETFVEGAFDLVVQGGTLYVFTADGTEVHATVTDPIIFTKIAERKARNPELERIERRMYLNQERRMQQQADDMERRYGRLLTAAEERVRHAEQRATAKPAAPTADTAPEKGKGDQAEQASGKDVGAGRDDPKAATAGVSATGKTGKADKG